MEGVQLLHFSVTEGVQCWHIRIESAQVEYSILIYSQINRDTAQIFWAGQTR